MNNYSTKRPITRQESLPSFPSGMIRFMSFHTSATTLQETKVDIETLYFWRCITYSLFIIGELFLLEPKTLLIKLSSPILDHIFIVRRTNCIYYVHI